MDWTCSSAELVDRSLFYGGGHFMIHSYLFYERRGGIFLVAGLAIQCLEDRQTGDKTCVREMNVIKRGGGG